MDIELISGLTGRRKRLWQELLTQTGLTPDTDTDVTCLVWQGDELVATGSRKDHIFKCVAVSPAHQGEDLTAAVLSRLRQDAFAQGFRHLFLYTKPQNRVMFTSLLFYPVAQTKNVLLMESRRQGIGEFLRTLPAPVTTGNIGAAVMNCNPFTLGHRYLIETAARQCDHVYIFVLSEDRSRFSAEDRMSMVLSGTEDIPNVTVLPTGPYLISSATFPTYFLKEREKATEIQCLLDIEIFLTHFVPHFGITRRYVGTEPLSPITGLYNETLKAHLPPRGVELWEIPRLEKNGAPISASALRDALDSHDSDTARLLLPETTLQYLEKHHIT